MSEQNTEQDGVLRFVKYALAALVVLVVLYVIVLAIPNVEPALDTLGIIHLKDDDSPLPADPTAADILEQAEAAADKAEDTSNNMSLLLSFLEGVAVLVGLALGATAWLGIRNFSETRKDLKEEMTAISSLRKEWQTAAKEQRERLDLEFEKQRDLINREFKEKRAGLTDEIDRRFQQTQLTFNDLLQAYQELGLNNHAEAYQAVMRVLEREPNNPNALYIAGWLEIQYIPGKKEEGINRLDQLNKLDTGGWPTAKAAYGVGLRRQARDETDPDRRMALFLKAEQYLLEALLASPNLLDLNQESLWGPVGGIRRDTGRLADAIEAYQHALRVTPHSSYPMGNLAGLYLEDAAAAPDPDSRRARQDQALDAFEKTLEFTRIEMLLDPNDYFHMMDVAMAATMLGQCDPAMFKLAGDTLDAVLQMRLTRELLQTSLVAGWRRLDKNCPDEWTDVKSHLQQAVKRIAARMDTLSDEPPA